MVIPTYNEAANVGPLLQALDQALSGVEAEYVVVDDDSRDGTARLAAAASPRARVVVRQGERGLATAVVRGMREARGTYVAVMDADFQHPPAAVRALLDRARATSADLVVGSRHARGGSEGGFGLARRAISRGARLISKAVLPPVRRFHLTDPMSGLFLVRRDRIDPAALRPSGYKILLEVLGRADLHRVEEVGYAFQDRRGGASKLGPAVMTQYLAHVLALGMQHPDNRRMFRFMAVGATGSVVTLGLLFALHEWAGFEPSLANLVGVAAGIQWNFLLNDRFTFRDRQDVPWVARLGMFNLVSLGGLAANYISFFVFHYFLGLYPLVAGALAILAAFAANYVGNVRFTYAGNRRPTLRRWLPIVVLVFLSGGLYFTTLDEPRGVYFDESYYLAVAYQMENGVWNDPCWDQATGTETYFGIPFEQRPLPLNYEHPPLAKLIMFASIHAYDDYHGVFLGCRKPDTASTDPLVPQPCYAGTTLSTGKECFDRWTSDMQTQGNPYAWRGPSALFGVLTVAFGALAARRIFQSDLAGTLAGALILADDLVLSTSRIALLDIFAAAFAVMALWAATHPTRKGVLGTFLFLGLGFSCKYYVLFAGPPIALVSLWAHWRAGKLTKRRFDLHWISALAIPLAVWAAAYVPWWVVWTRAHGLGFAAKNLVKSTAMAIKWDAAGGDQGHQYQSSPLDWLPMATPMSYIGPASPLGPSPEMPLGTVGSYVYAVGNPILWWGAALAVLYAVVDYLTEYGRALGRRPVGPVSFFASMPRIRQAILLASLVPLFAYGCFFLLHRTTFIFYMTLVVPFLAVALAGALTYVWASPSRWAKGAVVAACALVALGFLWFFQVSMYVPIPRDGFAWLPVPGTDLYYPALGFNDVMRAIPWMRPFGSQDCWDKVVEAALCT